jgi:hypothetical protein
MMATEGATGLSTEALEDVIDWREQSHNAQAARAELAVLQAAAQRAGALAAALSGLLGGINVYDRPDPGQSMCRGLHTLRAVDEAIALVVADAGPAGARDEAGRTAALARLVEAGRALPFVWAYLRADDPDSLDLSRAERAFCAALTPLLDAPRAGGAGDAGDQPR